MFKFFTGGVIACLLLVTAPVVRAHGDSHAEDKPHTEVQKTMSIAEMEQMVKLLQQLVAALLELKQLPQQAAVATPAVSVPAITPHEEEMDEHMDEHHEESSEDTGAKLVIEIEPHFGKTHAHVRYTDKPEEMFFVDVAIDNEDGIVDAIVAKTGLATDVVRAALKYMQ